MLISIPDLFNPSLGVPLPIFSLLSISRAGWQRNVLDEGKISDKINISFQKRKNML